MSAPLHQAAAHGTTVPHRVTVVDGPAFDVHGPDTVLQAALRAGIGFPYECSAGGCGSCRFDLLDGTVHTLWPQAPGLGARDRQKGRHLACQSVPCGPLTLRVRTDEASVPPVPPRRLDAVLSRVDDVTHDLRQFSFTTAQPAQFLPGQYALLDLAPGLRRAYSMSNLPNPDGTWQFIVRRVPGGAATAQLFDHCRVGDRLRLDGPYGQAWLRPVVRDLVCIAGGSGLAPMLAIARAAAPQLQAGQRRLHFFHGGRTVADCAARHQLADLLASCPGLHCHEVVSQPPGSGWPGATGWVHDAVDAALGAQLAAHEVYFAGPPPMVQATMDLLMVRRGVPFHQIHFDRFF